MQEVVATLLMLPHSLICYIQNGRNFCPQPCYGLSCMRRHSHCCHISIRWSAFLVLHLAWDTVLFMFVAIFVTVEIHNIRLVTHLLVCSLSLAVVGIPPEAAQPIIVNVDIYDSWSRRLRLDWDQ